MEVAKEYSNGTSVKKIPKLDKKMKKGKRRDENKNRVCWCNWYRTASASTHTHTSAPVMATMCPLSIGLMGPGIVTLSTNAAVNLKKKKTC